MISLEHQGMNASKCLQQDVWILFLNKVRNCVWLANHEGVNQTNGVRFDLLKNQSLPCYREFSSIVPHVLLHCWRIES